VRCHQPMRAVRPSHMPPMRFRHGPRGGTVSVAVPLAALMLARTRMPRSLPGRARWMTLHLPRADGYGVGAFSPDGRRLAWGVIDNGSSGHLAIQSLWPSRFDRLNGTKSDNFSPPFWIWGNLERRGDDCLRTPETPLSFLSARRTAFSVSVCVERLPFRGRRVCRLDRFGCHPVPDALRLGCGLRGRVRDLRPRPDAAGAALRCVVPFPCR
jgi:hypothetical protein